MTAVHQPNTQPQSLQTGSDQNLDWKRLANLLDTTSKVGLIGNVNLEEARAMVSRGTPPICSGEKALAFAEYMGKSMPTGAGTDFAIWLKDAAIVFSEYAEADVRLTVEHPTKGIRSKHKWLPQPSELIEFLNELRNRRGRIVSNARYVISELTKEPEPEFSAEHQAAMARKMENLARDLTGRRSLEAVEATQEQQEAFDAECLTTGDGDKQRGLEILMGLEPQPDPAKWSIPTSQSRKDAA